MSHPRIPAVTLVDGRGRKYLTAGERSRFLEEARCAVPADQTFALTLAHTGARVSEVLEVRAGDVDLEAGTIRVRTLKRRSDAWREVPVPSELMHALELVHELRAPGRRHGSRRLWPFSRATAHRKIARLMARASIRGPQACPKGLRHGYGIAAVAAGVPLTTIAAALGHASLSSTAVYTTAVGIEARAFLARMWEGT